MDLLEPHIDHILMIHAYATIFMCGVCWFVQMVHYPLFRHIDLSDLSLYERENLRTAIIAIPFMSIELVSGALHLWFSWSGLMALNMSLFLVIGLSTLIFQAPFHLRLIKAPESSLIDKLILSNWIRTVLWTIRSALVVYLLIEI